MKLANWILFFVLLLGLSFALLISCGDDDDDDDNDDSSNPSGTCEAFCEKNISCGDHSWDSVDKCADSCEGSPNRDCVLECDPTDTCGDWFDCMAMC